MRLLWLDSLHMADRLTACMNEGNALSTLKIEWLARLRAILCFVFEFDEVTDLKYMQRWNGNTKQLTLRQISFN